MMPNERSGNKRPRLQEVSLNNKPCLINAMGLPGPGAKIAFEYILDWPRSTPGKFPCIRICFYLNGNLSKSLKFDKNDINPSLPSLLAGLLVES